MQAPELCAGTGASNEEDQNRRPVESATGLRSSYALKATDRNTDKSRRKLVSTLDNCRMGRYLNLSGAMVLPGAARRQQRLECSAPECLNSTIPAEHVAVSTAHRRNAMTGTAKKSSARNMHSRQHHRQRTTNAPHRVWAGSTCDARPGSLCAAAGAILELQRHSLAAPSGQTSESGEQMVSTTARSLSGATEHGTLSSTVPPFPPGFVAPNPPSTRPSNSSTGTGTPSYVAFPLPLAIWMLRSPILVRGPMQPPPTPPSKDQSAPLLPSLCRHIRPTLAAENLNPHQR